ncbi:hypothetical protein GGQ87_000457 [Brevundimonas alba]|uniref:TonB C-terminal domain-containing protein n=1 Tax=Brevundimonas alba TaxID=74314 RepID=A0A7X5YIC4_9CAUL|nr:hypothetical protein [Brevundimonas alba]NJC40199.1 hypothetical protein [Brevundimonas alba]
MLNLIAALLVALAGQDAAPAAPTPAPSLDLVPLGRPVDPRVAAAAVGVFNQVYPHWHLRCDDPGFVRERIQFDVTLDSGGRIVAGPTVLKPRDDPAWRAAADSARFALISAAPFEVPDGFPGGRYRPTFLAERACAG